MRIWQIQIEQARLLVHKAALLKDAGKSFSQIASMAKCSATDTAMKVTTDAVQVYGGYGYTREYNVERHMRDAKVMQIVEGTNQIQRLVIAKNLPKTIQQLILRQLIHFPIHCVQTLNRLHL